ncbi:aminotransferase class III-fold pyridoxal phosphate-dependent enzyme, partial [bacterium]
TSITLTGEDRRWGGEQFGAPGVVRFFAPYPYRSPFFATTPEEECERALDHVRRVLDAEDPKRVAALLVEPVVGSNGVIVYPDGYLAGLRKLTEEHGILLIVDEVMTGFGRTGAAFASSRYEIVPDLLVFAKGVTSAYVPLGGVMVRETLAKTFDERALPCGHTYSGHPVSVAAGLATLAAYRENDLFERANEVGRWIEEHLAALAAKHEIVGDVRGVGAFHAIELVKDRATKEPLVPWQGAQGLGVMKGLYAELRKRGIYTFGRYNIAMIAPPLTTEKSELDDAFAGVDDALEAFARTLRV